MGISLDGELVTVDLNNVVVQKAVVIQKESQILLPKNPESKRCCRISKCSLHILSTLSVAACFALASAAKVSTCSEGSKITLIVFSAISGTIASLGICMLLSRYFCENRCTNWLWSWIVPKESLCCEEELS